MTRRVSNSTHRTDPASSLSELLERIDGIAEGAPAPDNIPTGFPSIDRILGGGFRRGDLIVLGGEVGSGKSALALAIALRVAAKYAVSYLSGEMTAERLMERVLAIEGRARIDDLRQGTLDELARASVGAAAVRLRDTLPRLARLPADGLVTTEGWKKSGKPDLVIAKSHRRALVPVTRFHENFSNGSAIWNLTRLSATTSCACRYSHKFWASISLT